MWKKYIHSHILNGIIHISQDLESMKECINGWIKKILYQYVTECYLALNKRGKSYDFRHGR